MKVLKQSREVTSAVSNLHESFWNEWWFDPARKNVHNGFGCHCCEEYLETLQELSENTDWMESELIESCSSDDEFQDTYNQMMQIWRKRKSEILFVDEEDLRKEWTSKYGSDETYLAIDRLDSFDKYVGIINNAFYSLGQRYGLTIPESATGKSFEAMQIPIQVLNVFPSKDRCEQYFNAERNMTPTMWGRRFKAFAKPSKDWEKGDRKNVFLHLMTLYPDISKESYSTFQKATI